MFAINVYSSIAKERRCFTFPEGQTIADYLKNENINFDNTIILVSGHVVTKDYEPKDNDIIFVRELPSAATTVALVITAVVAVVAGVAAGVSLYKAKQAQEEAENAMKNANSASSNVEALPFLKGANNQAASGRSFPYIIGRHYFTPYRLQPKYYEVLGYQGDEEYCNLVLEAGFNNLVIESISLGNNKIKTYASSFDEDKNIKPQSLVDTFDDGTYYDAKNVIEIQQTKEFSTEQFNKKIVSNFINQEITHDYGTATADVTPVVTQLESNAKAMDICILFDGLRKYVDNRWTAQSCTIKAYWSNLDSPLTSDLTQWTELTASENTTFVQQKWDGSYTINTNNVYSYSPIKSITSTPRLSISDFKKMIIEDTTHCVYVSGVNPTYLDETIPDITRVYNVTYNETYHSDHNYYSYSDVQFYYAVSRDKKYTTNVKSNTFDFNSASQMRFTLHKDFTAAESYGKNISVMLIRTTPKAESNSNESCYLYYVNTECYDPLKSTSTNLVTCKPIEDDAREKCCRIGIRMKADDNNESLSDSVNIIACGVARTWDSDTSVWSTDKTPTRNAAAWILEVLTSDVHAWSKFSDNEIEMSSLGSLYETCENKGYYVDGVITEDKTKQSVLDDLCAACHCSLIFNNDGLLEVIEDKAEENAIALLNTQDISDFSVTKSFARKPDGYKVTFTNNESWTKETFYCMKDGTSSHGATDVITEIAPNFITDYEHAWDIARRTLAESYLQPKTVTVNVGKEGAYYPLHSCVLVQLPHLKIGLASSVVTALIYTDNVITGIKIADKVTFESGKSYGVIIQQMDDYGKHLIDAVVTGEGTTDTLYLDGSSWEDIPTAQNILSFGELDDSGTVSKVTEKFKICDVAPTDNGYALTLKEYNESIYDDSGAIPDYSSPVTPQSMKRVYNYTTIEDVRSETDILQTSIQNLFNTHTITLYKESSSVLTDDKPTSNLIYDFSTNTMTWANSDTGYPKKSNGWSWEYPTEHTNTVYMISGTAQGQSNTISVVPSSWSGCIASGLNGVNGTNTYTITLYKRVNDQPTQKPSTLTYDFSTGTLSGTKNGWSTSIPAVTDEGLPAWEIHATAFSTTTTDTIEPSEWTDAAQITSDGITIETVKEIVQEELQDVVETPNVYADCTHGGFAVNTSGITPIAQSVSTTIHVLQTNEELDFHFDLDAIKAALPSGMTVSQNYHTLTFQVNEGYKLKSGNIRIPVVCKVFKYNNVLAYEIDNVVYQLAPTTDENAIPLGYSTYYEDEQTFYVGFAYDATNNGSYLGTVASESEIPSTVVIGDYFTFTGTSTDKFKTAAQYEWNGQTWNETTDLGCLSNGLKDVLTVLDTETAANNSNAVELLDKLTANIIYAKRVLANLLEADTVVSQKFATDYAEIKEAVFNKISTEEITIKSLDNYTTTDDLNDELAEKADTDDVPTKVSELTNDSGFTDDTTANDALNKANNSVIASHSIFYIIPSSKTDYTPSAPTEWVTTTMGASETWTEMNAGDNKDIVYECIQSKTNNGTLSCSKIERNTNNALSATGLVDYYRKYNKTVINGGYINTGLVRAASIEAGAITADKIDTKAITSDKIDASAITADKIDAGAVTTDKLDANAVTADKIKAGSISADKLDTTYASIDYLEGGDAKFSGDVTAKSLTLSQSCTIGENLTLDSDGTITALKGRFAGGIGLQTHVTEGTASIDYTLKGNTGFLIVSCWYRAGGLESSYRYNYLYFYSCYYDSALAAYYISFTRLDGASTTDVVSSHSSQTKGGCTINFNQSIIQTLFSADISDVVLTN